MTNPVTPNIGLNKIDRTSPSTTYFDLEKYIDQNADAVDRFAGESSDAIGALEKRLDTEERREVVLQPGLQIVNAERSAPFKLSGIKGRTLVNLAGRQTNRSVNSTSSTTIDVGLGSTGSNTQTVNVDINNTGEGYIVYRQVGGYDFIALAGKYYVILADVKINSISGNGLIKVGGSGAPAIGAYNADKTKIGVWQRVCHRFSLTSDSIFNILVGTCYAEGVFATANFDVRNVALHEISQSEYCNLRNISEKQLSEKYPYVDSVTPVRNPYVIRYGENLLPPFYEWSQINNKGKILSHYSYLQSEYDDGAWSHVSIPVMPFTNYVISFENIGGSKLRVVDNKTPLSVLLDLTDIGGTFNSGDNTTVSVYISGGIVGQVNNPMLTLRSTPKPFKPREDAILALQTDLYADPLTGANADEVFEKDGQYFRLAKWGKANLTDKFNYVGIGGKGAGWKQTFFDLLSNTSGPYSEIVVKYDGKKLQSNQITNNPDISAIDSGNAKRCYISIANTDSGWGDNYTPTADEIKAYFMGWTMYDGSGSNATPDNPVNNFYNGIGVKAWAYRADGVTRSWLGWTDKHPTTQAPNWTPYQLLYRLAKETIEPIVSEGMLTFNEGDNQIEIGTGIVLRESVEPVRYGDFYVINYTYDGSHALVMNKVDRFMAVYKNGMRDPGYFATRSKVTSYGNEYMALPWGQFDQSAAYSVTYLMLGNSPIVSFSGTYAVNEKAMFQKLTDSVKQNSTAVSMLFNKKANKNPPEWIKPTLVNGWFDYSLNDYPTFSFSKDSCDMVSMRGMIKGGAFSPGALLFKLPAGYRPKTRVTFDTACSDGNNVYSALVNISPDGDVWIFRAEANEFLSLFLPPFQAEQ
ncbi:hypothetical protein [Paenibacillus lautus]|uniref:hypothetical protein n=1 Tax=Paenibacillus lautus TaxID=1401 RepID=UPI003D2E7CFD